MRIVGASELFESNRRFYDDTYTLFINNTHCAWRSRPLCNLHGPLPPPVGSSAGASTLRCLRATCGCKGPRVVQPRPTPPSRPRITKHTGGGAGRLDLRQPPGTIPLHSVIPTKLWICNALNLDSARLAGWVRRGRWGLAAAGRFQPAAKHNQPEIQGRGDAVKQAETEAGQRGAAVHLTEVRFPFQTAAGSAYNPRPGCPAAQTLSLLWLALAGADHVACCCIVRHDL
jgi:hypothetical protein